MNGNAKWRGKRFWIVGASEGLGRALAAELSAHGAELILSARNAERLESLAASLPGAAEAITCDVTSADDVAASAKAAGRIDGVVYASGAYEPMSASEWRPDAVEAICDVNFMGAVRVAGAVAPGFIERDAGHIAMIGSLAGFRGLPSAIGYGASKAGMMHLAETLYADLRRTGVRVQLINPGFIKTRLTDKNSFKMPFIMTPEQAAERVRLAMENGGFQVNFPRRFAAFFRLGQFLPAPLYYRLVG